MEILDLEGTADTPKVMLDKKMGLFEISGRSLPENAREFYQPVVRWVEQYALDPNATTEFEFKLEYLNTGTSRLILDILSALRDVKGMKILWYFHDEDEDMEEAGEEFSELVKIPFDFRAY